MGLNIKPLTKDEIFIIESLISHSQVEIKIPCDLEKCYSLPMEDGGMGSFKIIYPNEEVHDFGMLQSIETEMDYYDGKTYVNIIILVDEHLIPREIDSFTDDSSPLKEPFKIKNIKLIRSV